MRHKWFGGENRELFGQRMGWRRVQYSEKPFPVFVLMSSLISVMQKNWSEEREDKKAQVRNQSILGNTESQQQKKGKTYGFYPLVLLSGAGCKSASANLGGIVLI